MSNAKCDLPPGFEVLFPGGNAHVRHLAHAVFCPRCGEPAEGVELPGIYDGIAYYRCVACRVKWHRFGSERPHLRAAVEHTWEVQKRIGGNP